MPSTRKRARGEMEAETEVSTVSAEPTTATSELESAWNPVLYKLRNMWQFANFFQWLCIFGKALKIDDRIDMDALETECLKPESTVFSDIGLTLLKQVSSHRGLNVELFDEYTRRQYVARKPNQNPFGTEEVPVSFNSFEVFTKIKVLQQLTQWVMQYPERIREKMDDTKTREHTGWRIEPYGWDADDRTYFILDDDRLYRLTDPPSPSTAPAWKPKKNSKKAKAAARAAKRRRLTQDAEGTTDDTPANGSEETKSPEDDGLGGAKWECIAITLAEVQAFLKTIQKTKDENEEILRDRILEGLVPMLEKHEEARQRKVLAREKELLLLEKSANAKRSSRLAGKAEKQKQEEEARQEEGRRHAEEVAAKKAAQKQVRVERERDKRLMARENRIRDRDARRSRHEEDLAQLSESSKDVDSNGSNAPGRLSGRRLQVEITKKKDALKLLQEEEDDWIFDCICGVHGQVDDGTHSIACERCAVWMHSKCVGISKNEAESHDFQFTCDSCKRKLEQPKSTVIKLKVKDPSEVSPSQQSKGPSSTTTNGNTTNDNNTTIAVEIPVKPALTVSSASAANGAPAPTLTRIPPPSLDAAKQKLGKPPPTIPIKPSGAQQFHPPSPFANGDGSNPFSSPHPTLSPPQQSPNKSRAYSTITHSSPDSATRTGEHLSLPPKGIFHVSPKTNTTVGNNTTTTAQVSGPTVSPAPPINTKIESPVKKNPTISTPTVSFNSALGGRPSSSHGAPPSVLSTPQLKPAEFSSNHATPTLPPAQNGFSPVKHSSPPAPPSSIVQSSPVSTAMPLSSGVPPLPLPLHEQNNTPPVKQMSLQTVSQRAGGAVGSP